MAVPTTGLMDAVAAFLTINAPVTHGYAVGQAPVIPAGVQLESQFFGVVELVDVTPVWHAHTSDSVADVLFQVRFVASTREQASKALDRAIRVLTEGSVPDGTKPAATVDDAGKWARTVRFMSIDANGSSFATDSDGLHRVTKRFNGQAVIDNDDE